MTEQEPLEFRDASEDWEFEQIYALNYRTFVEEIPQHTPNEQRILVDKLLAQSKCIVAVRGRRVVGMLAICGERPFSLDRKIENLDAQLPEGHGNLCEVRLLAIEPEERRGVILGGLIGRLLRYCEAMGFETGLISAAVRQRRLYLAMGFADFGPPIGTPDAPFQGMYVSWHTLARTMERLADARGASEERKAS